MDSLVAHVKISKPSLLAYQPYPRLLDLLDPRAHPAPIVWLNAPAGYGKTSLVAHYIERHRLTYLWYQLDPGDGDAATFFHHLSIAVERLRPDLSAKLPTFTVEYEPANFARLFFRTLFQHAPPLTWVLDNYHELPAHSELHDILADTFAELPPGFRAIVCSRCPPPSAYGRLRLDLKMQVVGKDALRLTKHESDALCRRRLPDAPLSADLLERLHRKTQGWAAGLVLLLNHLERDAHTHLPDEAQEVVFGYLASESFRLSRPEIRHLLIKTAFLPRFSATMAARISGLQNAGVLLEDMCRGNYLVSRHEGTPPTYSYHPLFRDFLLDQALGRLDPADLERLRRSSAELLLQADQLEAGMDLLRQNGDWSRLATLILRYAPLLHRQGRNRLLLAWMHWLPREHLHQHPWLAYWCGIAQFPFDPPHGRDQLEKAFHRFQASGQREGQLAAWSGIIESIICEWGYLKPIDYWLEQVAPLLHAEHPPLPSELKARVAFAMFIALMNRQPEHPDLPHWMDEVWQTVYTLPDPSTRLTFASHLLIYLVLWRGDLGRAQPLIDAIAPLLQRDDLSAFARITWQTMVVAYHWMAGEKQAALDLVDQTLALAQETGIHLWDSLLLCQAVITALSLGDMARARAYLDPLKTQMTQARALDRAMYYYVAGWYHYVQGQLSAAHQAVQTALAMTEEAGCVYFRGIVRAQVGLLQHRVGHGEQARRTLALTQEEGERMHTETVLCQAAKARAEIAYYDGDLQGCIEHLKPAIDFCDSHGILNPAWWNPDLMRTALARLLAEGHATDWIHRFIRTHRLSPPQDECDLEHWPWPIKIYTLGRFEVFVDGRPLHANGSNPRRLLQLLKTLIATGGPDRKVQASTIADLLWSEAEGDQAMNNLKMNVKRLRRLLGYEQALSYRHGQLGLDTERYCWIDCWAFEHILERPPTQRHLACLEKAFRLYTGPFLKCDEDDSCFFPMRTQLRTRFQALTLQLGGHYEGHGAWERAKGIYERALRIDPCLEVCYQRLMRCHAQLGDHAAIELTYRRCKRILNEQLNTHPSRATTTLYEDCLRRP